MNFLEHNNVTNLFEQNLREIIYNDLKLSQDEINSYNSMDFIEVLAIHKEYAARLIFPKNYHINISVELQEKINKNNFDDSNIPSQLNSLIYKLENSQDVIPNLSRSVQNKQYNDALYNDWKIYHLHLGTIIEADGFVERTKNVLFIMKEKDELYLIDILPHGRGELPWTKKSLLEIVDNNWPALLDLSDLGKGITPCTTFDEQEHYKLRKSNINVIMDINGRTLMPINFGQTLGGTSVMAKIISISLIKYLEFFHNFIVYNYQQISEFLDMENIVIKIENYEPEDYVIKFSIDNNTIIHIQTAENRKITAIIFIRKDIKQSLTYNLA